MFIQFDRSDPQLADGPQVSALERSRALTCPDSIAAFKAQYYTII